MPRFQARRVSWFFIGAVILAIFCFEGIAALHTETALCLLKDDLTCAGQCTYCHPTPEPDMDFYVRLHQQGDVEICLPCHENESALNNANLLSWQAGGNHPSQMEYDPAADPELKQPSSVVLFCGKGDLENSRSWSCKVLCSTCHDVHTDVPRLLRISNYGSALCYDCHDK